MTESDHQSDSIAIKMLRAAETDEPHGNVFAFPGSHPPPRPGAPLPSPGEYIDRCAPAMADGFANWPVDALKSWRIDWLRHVAIANMIVAHMDLELERRGHA